MQESGGAVQGMPRDGNHHFVEKIRTRCSKFAGIGNREAIDLRPLITDY